MDSGLGGSESPECQASDLGTKPLTKARINSILCWRNTYDGQGHRVGQEEHDRLGDGNVACGKIQKLAKLLRRIVLLDGLEHVAGERLREGAGETIKSSSNWMMLLVAMLMAIVICFLASSSTMPRWME